LNNKRSTGCLIIHGFGGNYKEVSPLAVRLEQRGYNVVCPVLAGHTGRRYDMKRAGYNDWIRSAERKLQGLLAQCKAVYIIGFSMGGLIGINLALKYDVAGMVTINMPIYYWDSKLILSNIAKGLAGRDFRTIKRYMRATVKFPLRALLNFSILLGSTKPLLNDVTCPILITQGLDDDTVRKSSARYIFDSISSDDKQLKFYKDSGHVMLWSHAADNVIRDIEAFLED